MVSGEQIIALIKGHYLGDERRFRTLSLQIASEEARKGHSKIAKEIKDIVNKYSATKNNVRQLNQLNSTPIPSFIYISYPNESLRNLIISEETENQLTKVINEYKNKKKLEEYGLKNRRKILLIGPPGTGKTMTSNIIASELAIPLYTIQLDKIMTKFLGESSKKLREIFNFISNNMGVYLFDEFDAIGSDRSFDNEVGEMRRILNSFLVLLENDLSSSIIIAATNNPELLDEALFRRFDDVIQYNIPSCHQIKMMYERSFNNFDFNYEVSNEVVEESMGLSHAEILNISNEAIKDHILSEIKISEEYLMNIINKRKNLYNTKFKEA